MLERARQLYVDCDALEVEASQHLLREARTASAKVRNQHAAAEVLDRLVDAQRARAAVLMDAQLVADVNDMRGTDAATLAKFYTQFEALRSYHDRFPGVALCVSGAKAGADEDDGNSADAEPARQVPEVPFSGAESHGRHLDLHSFYDAFLNLAYLRRKREADESFTLSYRDFVRSFAIFSSADARHKDDEYLHYLLDLLAYVVDFLRRAQPLLDVRKTLEGIAADAQRGWDNGSHMSWGDAVAPDPLYCAACDKLFTKQSVFDGHLPGKKHVSAAKRLAADSVARDVLAAKIFLEETKLHRLVNDTLHDVVEATLAEIEKKQARTLREQLEALEQDSDEVLDANDAPEDEEEAEQGFVKQIRNYPVGWDGEPIPYWLYRLHGLGVEYKCEICGNASFWGRRAFEKHFEDFRHQNGLKLLGIPNTPHFFDVVRIQDALDLHKKIQAEEAAKAWVPDDMVEMEDDQGRVYDRKTFELLRKQGVIKEAKK